MQRITIAALSVVGLATGICFFGLLFFLIDWMLRRIGF
jgi:hypothetical protein